VTHTAPTICRIVKYTLSYQDADTINRRRSAASHAMQDHRDRNDGVNLHIGNRVQAGDVYPLIITRVWQSTPDGSVNGQVLLDGNDTHWVTSVTHGEGERTWAWPV
jgi:hypothetical protein